MPITIAATTLVVVGVVLAGLLEGWSGVALPLGLSYLGVAVLLLATAGAVPAAVCVATGVGVELVLVPGSLNRLVRGLRGRSRPVVAEVSTWLSGRFALRWFDLSTVAVVLVGALDLAAARPVLGGGTDLVVDVLMFGGLLYCLIVRPGRAACGVLFLALAAGALIQDVGQPPARAETLLTSAVQIGLALALAHFRAVEENRMMDGTLAPEALSEHGAPSSASSPDEAGQR